MLNKTCPKCHSKQVKKRQAKTETTLSLSELWIRF